MHELQWKEHKKFSIPSLPNPTKSTNAVKKYEKKIKDERTNSLKKLDPKSSCHEEER